MIKVAHNLYKHKSGKVLPCVVCSHLNDIMVYFMLIEEIGREVNSALLKMTIVIGGLFVWEQ